MRFNNRTLIISIIIAGICLCVLIAIYSFSLQQATGSAPLPVGATEEPAAAEPTQHLPSVLPTSPPAFTPQPAINESRRLTLEFPPTIRAGDSDIVRLTLEVDDQGSITPTAQIEGNIVTGEVVQIPNLYESHHVIVEARFDIAGMQVSPPELTSQTLEQGQSVTFRWSIYPTNAGTYRGTVWLYLRFVDKLNGEESRITVSAQIVEIKAANLFGLSGSLARTTGVIGSVVGTIIGFPFFEDIVKYLFRKRKKA